MNNSRKTVFANRHGNYDVSKLSNNDDDGGGGGGGADVSKAFYKNITFENFPFKIHFLMRSKCAF